MVRLGGVLVVALAFGCGRSIRYVDADAGVSASAPSPPPDDPQGFADPPSDVCTCAGDDLPACCATLRPDAPPCQCGNGVIDSCAGKADSGRVDACDGTDLGGQSCASLGYVSGTLLCSDACSFDTSGCDYCPIAPLLPGCAQPYTDNDDIELVALAANGDELAVAFVTGTSKDGYDGTTSVRLGLLDAHLNPVSSVATELPYASSLSLAPTPDGWLLLVESVDYEAADAPPNGVVQTLLSFDETGTLRGTVAFHGRRNGMLVPRDGAEPLYVFATDDGGVPNVWGELRSFSGTDDVPPFIVDPSPDALSRTPSCGAATDEGVFVLSGYADAEGEGYHADLALAESGAASDTGLPAKAPGACALASGESAPALIYQAQAPHGSLATFQRYPLGGAATLLGTDDGPVSAYRAVGFGEDGGHALVLRSTAHADLEVWDVTSGGQVNATLLLGPGAQVPSYDLVRFGDGALAAWVSQPKGEPAGGHGTLTLAKLNPAFP
ncbi:MAG TPA: hypothetical protein VMI54_14020 [Polyangiaceae bacterium]|nr:hypothetical protein [Polyangiaceae bacterium]